ncbi:tandem-95 repeat protein [Granulosicoccus antarcticus]|uniref:Cadherin domain-containing protein n=1 Tax=Granulosicoccus antarcticus IMCC3135 TaxID=1192854 RepID=A0A2Z2NU39_9GAMM|nr:tandem-95 repeat protein [Granulosicoccus antarcticus]ASJ70624.1 hypothetical protein IMCC3135_02555 [Granulosicoccus antarcticus IMCC3135]
MLKPKTLAEEMYREVDLSTAATATLSFAYTNPFVGTESVAMQVSGDGGISYSTLHTFDTFSDTGSGTKSFDISSYIASDTRIRLLVESADAGNLSIDDIQIEYTSLGGGTSAFSTASDTATLTVEPVADTPSVTNATTSEDTQSATGLVLSRNTADGTEVSHYKITGIADGTLYKNDGVTQVTNGSFITIAEGNAGLKFTPSLDFNGTANFNVQASTSGNDSGLGGGLAVASVTVTPVNDVPVATGNAVTASEDVPLVINEADFLFTDPENNDLVSVTISGLNLNAGTLTHSAGSVTVTDGMTILVADLADLTFTSALNDSTNSSFTYKVNDSGSGVTSALMNITVNPVNDVPVATGNTVTASEDVSLVIDESDFLFSDTENDDLVSVTIDGLNLNSGTLTHSAGSVTVTNGMTILVADLADLTFTSALNDSTNSSFTYKVNDSGSGVTSALMNITVNPVNDVPVATGNTVTASEDVPLVISEADFLFTDTENNDLVSVTISGLNLNSGTLTHSAGSVTITDGMTILAADLADLTFTSAHNDSTNSSFTYKVNDSGSGVTPAQMNITVNPVNDVPVATGNTVTTSEDVPLVIEEADFLFTDTENNDLVSVTITGLDLNGGTLTHSAGSVNVTNGMTILAADLADLTFTSALNDSTDSSFTYKVNDSSSGVTSALMNITVNPVNDVPEATGNTVTTSEDVPLVIDEADFLFTDTENNDLVSVTITGLDLNGGTLTHSAGSVNVTNGMTILAADLADLTFTSALNDSTDSSFSYTVNDSGSGVTPALMNITVNPVNDVPEATGNTVTASEDVPLVINEADFLFTDTENNDLVSVTITGLDLNGGTLTHSAGSVNVTNSMTILAADLADLTFTSALNDSTDSSFSYTVNDSGSGVTPALMNITVNPVNDVPEATGNTVTASEDVPLVIDESDFLFTDTENNGLVSVTISGLNLNSGTLAHSAGSVTITDGMTILAADLADLTFTSALNDSTNSSFTYKVNDSGSGVTSALMNITVNPVNDVPEATGNTVTASEDVPLVIEEADFLFTDTENNDLVSVTISGLNLNSGTLTHSAGSVTVTNGMTILAADLADLTFTSALNDSTNSSFTYKVNDSGSGVTPAQMNITVNPVNDVPVATGNTVTTSEDVPLVIEEADFLFTDTENNDLVSVTITGLDLNGGTLTHSAGSVNVTNGMTILAADLADLTFTSALNDSTDSSFTYKVNDSSSGVTSALMNITVNPINDVPEATGNTVTASEDVPVVIEEADFLFTDTENNDLVSVTITGLDLNGGTLTHSAGSVNVTDSMTILAADLADLTFTSALNDSTDSSFSYTVNDSGSGVTPALMNITVNPVNDVPEATGNTVTASEDVPLVINEADFLFTDTENNDLVSVTITGLDLNGGTLTHSAGSVNVTNSMTILAADLADLTFTSAPNDSTNSSFSYTVNDSGSGVTSAPMNITVNPVNDVPVATGNSVTASEDVPLVIDEADFLFTDPENNDLVSVTIDGLNLNAGTLTHSAGSVTVTNGMTILAADLTDLTFTSALNDATNSSFTYKVNDSGSGVTSALMNITVNPVNDVPVATGNTVTASEDVPLVINEADFLFTDTENNDLVSVTITGLDLNGGTLTHSAGSVNVTNGMTILAADLADLTFTSALNDSTNSSFTYKVNDSGSGVTPAQMNITVNPVNDVPVATGNTVTTSEDVPLVIEEADFLFTDTENNDLVSVTITGLDLNGGTLTHSAGSVNVTNGMTILAADLADLTFTSALNDSTDSSFTYKVNDSSSGVTSALMNITVNPINDVPEATGNTVTASEDVPVVIEEADFLFTDTENNDLVSVTITGLDLNGGTLTHSAGSVNVTDSMTILAADLADLTFTSALNDSTDSSFSYTVNDSGSGVTPALMNITVNPVNDVPEATGNTVTASEDVPLVINEADFLFTDTENNDLVSVTITGLDLNAGTLTHSAGSVNVTNSMTILAADLADLTFTSALNDSTDSSFSYTVNDAGSGVTPAQMNITVNPVNDVPVATGNSVTASEDVPLVIDEADFLFTDPENNDLVSVTIDGLNLNAGTLTHSAGSVTVTNGMTILAADLTDLTFTSALNDSTDSSFTYKVNDSSSGVTSALMNITVNPINDVPEATGNTVTASEDVPLVIEEADFLFTDTENNDLVSVTITGLDLNGGTLTHSAGSVNVTDSMTILAADLADLTFTSALNDSTDSSFSYTVNDSGSGVTPALMNITVNPVNDVPEATGNTVTASEDVPLVINEADFLFTDTENNDLVSVTITGLDLNGGTLTHSAGSVNVTNGMTILAADLADLTFTSALNDSTNSSFTYKVNDSGSGVTSALMNITVNPVNDVPVATGNTVTASEDVPLVINEADFLFTDTENNGLVSVTISGLNLNSGTLAHSAGSVTITDGMTILAADLADLTFTSALNDSTNSSFTYKVNDSGSGVTSALMNITVNPVNDVPVATGNTVTASEDVPLVINEADFLFTDTENNGLVSVTISGLNLNSGTLAHSAGSVTITDGMTILAADLADLTFTSALNDSTNSSFTYKVNDSGSGVTSALMNITVNPVNDVPEATGNTVTASEDVPLVIEEADFLFTDTENNDLVSVTISGLNLNSGTLTHSAGSVTVTNGMTILAADLADLTFTSALNDSTNSSFTYKVNDSGSGVTPAQMNITVNPVNDVPVATGNTVTTSEDVPLVIEEADFLFTDTENNDLVSVTITGLDLNGGTLTHSAGSVNVTNGMTILAADLADLTFTSALNNSTNSSFTYKVNDSGSGATPAQMNITVNPVNDVPVATGNTVTASEDVPLVIDEADFLFTDTENNDLVSVTITGLGLNGGTLAYNSGTVNVTNSMTILAADLADLTFTSALNNSTNSSFSYTVNDSSSGVTSALMNITVNPVNDVPGATGNTVTASEDVPLVINEADFLFTDTENNDLVSVTITGLDLNGGTLAYNSGTVNVTNSMTILAADLADLTFTSALNDSTNSSFTYTVNDSGSGVTSALMNITVNPVNDVPEATGNIVTASEDVPLVINEADFLFTDTENNDLVSVTITGLDLNGGTLAYNSGTVNVTNSMTILAADLADLTFTSALNDSTNSSFTYTVNDSGSGVTSALMNITVNPVNDVPEATGNTVTASEDVPLVINEADFLFTDTENNDLVSVTITGLDLNGGTLAYNSGTVNVTNSMTILAADLADLTFTSALNDSTNSSFTYTVNDSGSGVTSALMNITVNPVNDVPEATGNIVTASEDVPLVINEADFLFTDTENNDLVSVTITGLDLNGGTLTHSAGSVNVTNSMTILAADLADLTFTSALNDSTNSSFTYTVNDSGSGVTSALMNITVNPVNDVPEATGNTVTASEDVPLVINEADFLFTDTENNDLVSVTIMGLDLNGGTLTHSAGSVNVTNSMTILAANLTDLTFTSALNDSTNSSFTYKVNDSGSGATSALMNITVNPVNDVPTFESVPLTSATEDAVYNYNITTIDGDGNPLKITATTLPDWLTLTDNENGTASLTGTPLDAEVGSHSVVLEVTDGTATTEQSFSVLVTDTNDAPTFTSPAAFTVAENTTVVATITSTDDTGTGQRYSLVGFDDDKLFNIESATGILSFNDAPNFESPTDFDNNNIYDLTVQVEDGAGLSATLGVTVNVVDVNEAPSLTVSELWTTEGFTGDIGMITFTDPDIGDQVSLHIVGGSAQAYFSVDPDSGSVHAIATLTPGAYTLEVQLRDANGMTINAQMQIHIDPIEPDLGAASSPIDSAEFANESSIVTEPDEQDGYSLIKDQFDSTDQLGYQSIGKYVDFSKPTFENSLEEPVSGANTGTSLIGETINTLFSANSYATHHASYPLDMADIDYADSRIRGYNLTLELLFDKTENVFDELEDTFASVMDGSLFSITLTPDILRALSSMHSDVDEQQEQSDEVLKIIVQAGAVASMALTVGFVTWLLQSGSLLATALSTAPLWRAIDPIPVLKAGQNEDDDHSCQYRSETQP